MAHVESRPGDELFGNYFRYLELDRRSCGEDGGLVVADDDDGQDTTMEVTAATHAVFRTFGELNGR